jgi:hypothetical protein
MLERWLRGADVTFRLRVERAGETAFRRPSPDGRVTLDAPLGTPEGDRFDLEQLPSSHLSSKRSAPRADDC